MQRRRGVGVVTAVAAIAVTAAVTAQAIKGYFGKSCVSTTNG